jgi:hypothetical protein
MKKEPKTTCEEKDNMCAICFDSCGKYKTMLECGHTFDTKCVFKWLAKNNNCPCCRASVDELKREPTRIRLPNVDITGAIYRLCSETVGPRFQSLSGVDQVRGWYMMFKIEMESLSSDEYEEMMMIGE